MASTASLKTQSINTSGRDMDESGNVTHDARVEMWKTKQLVKKLSAARGAGTSLISIIIPAGGQIGRVTKMLDEELGTAAHIKSRVTRQSVITAIKSTREKLKTYSHVPPNGLAVYCGIVLATDSTGGGGSSAKVAASAEKSRKVNIDFEPLRPVHVSFYHCDNRFHVKPIAELLQDDDTFGFIIIDGNGCLYGTLCGRTRHVLQKFSVRLPKKHGRGGFSAARYGRLRMEARLKFVRKCTAAAKQLFIDEQTNLPNVHGLVIAGAAALKTNMLEDSTFDPRLSKAVLKVLDVSYGGDNGFSQAIELAAPVLRDVKYFQEKKIISRLFSRIARDSGTCAYGLQVTMDFFEAGAVETLIVSEDLEIERVELEHPVSGTRYIHFLEPLPAGTDTATTAGVDENAFGVGARGGVRGGTNGHGRGGGDSRGRSFCNVSAAEVSQRAALWRAAFVDRDTGVELHEVSREPLVEWLAEHYRMRGARLEFVTDRSQEGAQFRCGFGGIGALLRWKVDPLMMAAAQCQHQHERDGDNVDRAHNGGGGLAGGNEGELWQGRAEAKTEAPSPNIDDFDFGEFDATCNYEDDFM